MYQTRILNNQEVKEYNEKFNSNYKIIHIQQKNNKFYAILDCDTKLELKPKEVLNYFNN